MPPFSDFAFRVNGSTTSNCSTFISLCVSEEFNELPGVSVIGSCKNRNSERS